MSSTDIVQVFAREDIHPIDPLNVTEDEAHMAADIDSVPDPLDEEAFQQWINGREYARDTRFWQATCEDMSIAGPETFVKVLLYYDNDANARK